MRVYFTLLSVCLIPYSVQRVSLPSFAFSLLCMAIAYLCVYMCHQLPAYNLIIFFGTKNNIGRCQLFDFMHYVLARIHRRKQRERIASMQISL